MLVEYLIKCGVLCNSTSADAIVKESKVVICTHQHRFIYSHMAFFFAAGFQFSLRQKTKEFLSFGHNRSFVI